MRITDLADVVRAAGLRVIEVEGWRDRARSGDGGQYLDGRPDWIMVHHTASRWSASQDVSYLAEGAEYAPLSNLYLARDGTVYVIAAGPTNTNGSGGPMEGVAANDMNRHAIGIEAGNDGVGEAWPKVQTDAYVTLCAALSTHYRIPVGHVCGHAEWSPGRKIDPAGPSPWAGGASTWNMDGFRRSVQAALSVGPEPITPPSPEEDHMKLYACVDHSGTVWVGDGIRRRSVASPSEFDLIALRGVLGSGPGVFLACGEGAPATMDNVASCRMDAAQLQSLGHLD